MESKDNKIRSAAIAEFKKLSNDKIIILNNPTLSVGLFLGIAKENKDVKVEYIENDILHPIATLSNNYIGGPGKGLPYEDIEGMYKITVKTPKGVSHMIVYGYTKMIMHSLKYLTFVVTGHSNYRLINNLFKSRNIKLNRLKNAPPIGIYELTDTKIGAVYQPLVLKNTNEILHPGKEELRNIMDMHFKAVKHHYMIGKALIYGDFGTGKSEAVAQVIQERINDGHEVCVVYVKCALTTVSEHLVKCRKYKISTIVVIEEAEAWLHSNEAKFFIGSHNEPKIKEGGLMLFVTNSPSLINKGFVRKGRIDWRIPFTKERMRPNDIVIIFRNALEKYKKSYRCKTTFNISDDTILTLKHLSGADIIGTAQIIVHAALMNNYKIVDDDIFLSCLEIEQAEINQASKFDANNKMTTSGFVFNAKQLS